MSDMVILAGGLGTRLRDTVPGKQKVVAPVGSQPFLFILLDYLSGQGITRVILALGYLSDQVKSLLSNFDNEQLEIVFSVESQPLGTGGALKLALPHVKSERVWVMNGDSFIRFELQDVIDMQQQKEAAVVLVSTFVDDVSRFGSIETSADCRVTAFLEKKSGGGKVSGWVNAGVYYLKAAMIECIPEGNVSIEKEMFPQWLEQGVFVCQQNMPFIDIGTPESYGGAEEFFKP